MISSSRLPEDTASIAAMGSPCTGIPGPQSPFYHSGCPHTLSRQMECLHTVSIGVSSYLVPSPSEDSGFAGAWGYRRWYLSWQWGY